MIPVPAYRGSKVAVFGLGRTGLAAARALAAGGSDVLVDDDVPARRGAAAAFGARPAALVEADWSDIEALVLSPGVPLDHPAPHPVVAAARENGVEVIGEVELLGRALRPRGGTAESGVRLVGITGTNGKSTTTALVGHVLGEAGIPVQAGGNLGPAALELDPLADGGVYVLEMSSYQLDLTSRVVFDVAALLNVTPDHLDRHGGLDGYVAAKRRIFDRQTSACTAVVAVDDQITAAIFDGLAAAGGQRTVPVSLHRRLDEGVYVEDGVLFDALDGGARPVMDLSDVAALPGAHNRQNAAVAYAVARVLGVAPDRIAPALGSYSGLAHRLELVATRRGVRYVNDSKATNVTAAAQALGCYESIYWIAGGRAKDSDLTPLIPLLPRVRHAFLIGEAAEHFAAALAGRVPVTVSKELEAAVANAASLAAAEGGADAVVLLSPACASFDQFRDFEARGDRFRALIRAMPRAAGEQ